MRAGTLAMTRKERMTDNEASSMHCDMLLKDFSKCNHHQNTSKKDRVILPHFFAEALITLLREHLIYE